MIKYTVNWHEMESQFIHSEKVPGSEFVAWDCDWARASDEDFRTLITRSAEELVVLADSAFHGKTGDPRNVRVCPRGAWNARMLIETVLSMLTAVCHLKRLAHRQADYFRAHKAFVIGAFNLLVQRDGLTPDAHEMVHLSIAEFSL